MFARLLLVCCVAAGCNRTSPEDAAIKKTAKAQAEEIQTALVKGDFGKVADLTHPQVVKMLGGKDKMLAVMAESLTAMKEAGLEFKDLKIADPSDLVKAGKEMYIVVPHSLEMTGRGKRLAVKGALVGVSEDGGKTWVFVDANVGRETIKKVLPGLPDSLSIPKPEAPKPID